MFFLLGINVHNRFIFSFSKLIIYLFLLLFVNIWLENCLKESSLVNKVLCFLFY
jgi:hypothetical protein